MFRRLFEPAGGRVHVTIDGKPVAARAGDSVAAAMLAWGLAQCRTMPGSGQKRAPYCMTGVCFDCLVSIDGVDHRQGCLVKVSEGMRIEAHVGGGKVE
jgi:hypothetical protein